MTDRDRLAEFDKLKAAYDGGYAAGIRAERERSKPPCPDCGHPHLPMPEPWTTPDGYLVDPVCDWPEGDGSSCECHRRAAGVTLSERPPVDPLREAITALREAITTLLKRWEADRWEDAVWGEAYIQLEDVLTAPRLTSPAVPEGPIDDEPCVRCGVWRRFHVEGPEYSRDHSWVSPAVPEGLDAERPTVDTETLYRENESALAAAATYNSALEEAAGVVEAMDADREMPGETLTTRDRAVFARARRVAYQRILHLVREYAATPEATDG